MLISSPLQRPSVYHAPSVVSSRTTMVSNQHWISLDSRLRQLRSLSLTSHHSRSYFAPLISHQGQNEKKKKYKRKKRKKRSPSPVQYQIPSFTTVSCTALGFKKAIVASCCVVVMWCHASPRSLTNHSAFSAQSYDIFMPSRRFQQRCLNSSTPFQHHDSSCRDDKLYTVVSCQPLCSCMIFTPHLLADPCLYDIKIGRLLCRPIIIIPPNYPLSIIPPLSSPRAVFSASFLSSLSVLGVDSPTFVAHICWFALCLNSEPNMFYSLLVPIAIHSRC